MSWGDLLLQSARCQAKLQGLFFLDLRRRRKRNDLEHSDLVVVGLLIQTSWRETFKIGQTFVVGVLKSVATRRVSRPGP